MKQKNELVGQKEFEFDFAIGDQVHVDHDDKLTLTIIAVKINPEAITYELSWFCDGRHVAEWFDAFRISNA